ncbi:OmpA family protein [Hymenobacter jeollabukensis]|uniref:OmpA family protein n=1 Tax=Hymenobacter jeollabukensis TaxID=2025313 RepID=A0A5R8WQL1_9BACT|nr:OmpA family protein [Hymenobacter jeollabukensis]TLM93025.1 OmpA family protein [Hymenobacter jeollabukensis]
MKHTLLSDRWLLLPLALLAAPRPVQAQTPERHTSFGINLSALQYQGDYGSDYWKFDRSKYAGGIAINQYLGRGLDLSTQLFYGELSGSNALARTRFNTTLINANAGLKFKLNNGWALKETAFIQPYLLAAGGWTYTSRIGWVDNIRSDRDQGYFDVFGAAGINFRLGPGVGLFVQTGQHLPLDANIDGVNRPNDKDRWDDRFLQHTVGLTFNLGQARDEDGDDVADSKDRCPGTPTGILVDDHGCPLDSDRDGVPDYQDQCPDQAGTAELKGCADKDGDGVSDGDDACPDVAGKPELQGCPDADNDGVPDQEDKCADTPAGTQVDPSGCPVAEPAPAQPAPEPTPAPAKPSATADTDGDGVPDAVDRCPTSAGPASNKGCPIVRPETRKSLREATRFISFEPNRAALLPSSHATLDGIAQILRDYPDYSLSIAGHTDSKGPAAFNQRLSRERAAAARSYLAGQGIAEERLQLRGYGPARPIAPNTTEAGRAKNRRVEFDLFLTGDRNAAEVKYGKEPTGAPAKAQPARPARKAPARTAVRSKTAVKAPTKRPAARKPAPAKASTAKAPVAKPKATVTPQKASPKR